jgi:competence protein ComEC
VLVLWLGFPRLPGEIELAAIDVGQGQSFAALTKNAAVLIDCGSIGSADNAGDAAADYLNSYRRRRVDLLVLTHFHADHANGVSRLMHRVDVARLAYPTDCEQNVYMDQILALCAAQGVELLPISVNTTITIDGLELDLFAPLGSDEINEHGLLVRGDWGDFEFLITGDAGAEVERALCAETELGDMELLVVGHHGSRYSTCDELLEDITPETAFISVGAGNDYGHPTAEVLRRLADHGIQVFRTDLDGTISLSLGE